MIVILLVGNAHAFQMTHIQSQLQDYGNTTGYFGGYFASVESDYVSATVILESPDTLTKETSVSLGLLTKEMAEGDPSLRTDAELASDIEFMKNANNSYTKTFALNSLFQVSEDTLFQLQTQINTGFNSDALRVTPSLKLGFTIAKQVDEDNSFTFSLSPKLVLGGDVSSKKTRFFFSSDKDLGTVPNGTTVEIEWTHKF